MKNKMNSRGFTLVETIIYIVFVAIFSGFVIASLIIVMKEFYSLRLTREINQSANVVFERMTREAKNAYDIDTLRSTALTPLVCSGAGCLHDSIVFRKRDVTTQTNTTVEFYVNSNNQVALREGGVEKGTLTSKNVDITALYLRDFDEGGPSRAIDVALQITANDAHYGFTRTSTLFSGMIVLRGETH